MNLKHPLFTAIALTVASVGGAQSVQAQTRTQTQSQSAAQSPDDYLIGLYARTEQRLQDNGKLVISRNEAIAQIQASGVGGAPVTDTQAEAVAERALDRSALPLIRNFLDPQSPVSAAEIDKSFKALATYMTARTKNIATVAAKLEQMGLGDAALIFALADDLNQGGTLAGFYARAGNPRSMQMAVVEHYTGIEAGKVIDANRIDIRLRRRGQILETNGKKRTLDIPALYLGQEKIKRGTAYAYREFAAQLQTAEKTPGAAAYVVWPDDGGDQVRPTVSVAYADRYRHNGGYNFDPYFAPNTFLPGVAARLAALPPEPKAEPHVAKLGTKKSNIKKGKSDPAATAPKRPAATGKAPRQKIYNAVKLES